MKKKLMLFLVTALMGLIVLTACGSSENTEQPGNNVSDAQQEEIPAIDNPDLEDESEATPTPTLSPTPTPEVIQPGRLLLNLSQNIKEYGSAEIDFIVAADLKLTDEDVETLKDSGYFDDIEIENIFSMKVNGEFASSKDGGKAELNLEFNEYGLISNGTEREYMQRNADGDLLDYYYSGADGMWYVYNEGDVTTFDLTDWIEYFGVAQISQLSTVNVFDDLTMTEEGDLYLIDGKITFDRFMKMTEIGNMFYADELAAVSDDLGINIHAEFGKAKKDIRFFTMYLDNTKELAQENQFQFRELSFEVKFNVTPDGEKIVVPMDIVNSAVSAE